MSRTGLLHLGEIAVNEPEEGIGIEMFVDLRQLCPLRDNIFGFYGS